MGKTDSCDVSMALARCIRVSYFCVSIVVCGFVRVVGPPPRPGIGLCVAGGGGRPLATAACDSAANSLRPRPLRRQPSALAKGPPGRRRSPLHARTLAHVHFSPLDIDATGARNAQSNRLCTHIGSALSPRGGQHEWRASPSRRLVSSWPRGPENRVASILGPLWTLASQDRWAWRHTETSFVRAATSMWRAHRRRRMHVLPPPQTVALGTVAALLCCLTYGTLSGLPPPPLRFGAAGTLGRLHSNRTQGLRVWIPAVAGAHRASPNTSFAGVFLLGRAFPRDSQPET